MAELSADYPYDKKLKREVYEKLKRDLQVEMLKMQKWVRDRGMRIVILFEGRDAAGKGGTIKRFMEHLNPRTASVVALSKPTEHETGLWYFQRYLSHLPTMGQIALMDRSWYNRAGVEQVMGFCKKEDYELFLEQAPILEKMLIDDGIILYKYWFSVSREEQARRFSKRKNSPLKQWKLSPIDTESQDKWQLYTRAKEIMFDRTHFPEAPWTIIKSDDKRRARINAMRHMLFQLDYPGKDMNIVVKPDPKIVGGPEEMLDA